MAIPFMRPVQADDLDQIFELAKQSGGGMTNLPADLETLRSRIEFAVESFTKQAEEPSGEVYMLVLEDDGKVLGTSAVFSAIGLDHGFVNYRINKTVHASTQLKKRVERRILVPSHDFTGCSEVGSLFLSPDARGGGFGKYLAKARYLFIAEHRDLVADPVCAELRGWRAETGEQPFWDGLGRLFFDMEFEAADLANSSLGNQFIADMMPRHPIYVALLPEAARECLGRPHDSAAPAFNMLLKEGFAFRGYIDVFDGGPLVDAPIDDIKTVQESKVFSAKLGKPGEKAATMLISAGRLAKYRVIRNSARAEDDTLIIDEQSAQTLGVADGDAVRAVEW
ncbi:MAG: arginine N-succinyltransferase [Pseudomonadota bacterium]